MSKLTKQELRAPDQIWRASANTYDWVKNHWIWISVAGVASLVIAVAVLFSIQVQNRNEAAAQGIFGEILRLYSQVEIASQGEGAGSLEEDRVRLQGQIERLRQEYPRSAAARFSKIIETRLILAEGGLDEGIQNLSELRDSLRPSDREIALYPLAKLYEEKGDWVQALGQYEQILRNESSVYRPWALLGKARSLRESGNPRGAMEAYDQFIQDNPRSTELSLVRGLRSLAASELAQQELP